jgi:hypothetical protein
MARIPQVATKEQIGRPLFQICRGVEERPAEHGFTRSFELDKEPKRQDTLTTCIEYLDFEYCWYAKDEIRQASSATVRRSLEEARGLKGTETF